ncbi:hypothetical protein PFISCL1PPCAC_11733, partial [Pristionchus fissidentatus]
HDSTFIVGAPIYKMNAVNGAQLLGGFKLFNAPLPEKFLQDPQNNYLTIPKQSCPPVPNAMDENFEKALMKMAVDFTK